MPEAPTTEPKPFDAGRFVVDLRGKDYLEVKWRIVWLRSEEPDAVIETELVRFDPPLAIFRAKVTLPSGGSATGWGQEEAADFGDYLEKAETKAIGRALAALGFGTQFAQEMTEGETRNPTAQPKPSPQDSGEPATSEQRQAIATMCAAIGIANESVDVAITSAQAAAMIKQLNARLPKAGARR